MTYRLGTLLLAAAALSMLLMSAHYLYRPASGILMGKAISTEFWYRGAFRIHVGGGLLAMLFAPVLCWALIVDHRGLHRSTGRVYGLSVLLSSLAGMIVAPFAIGGWWAGSGFLALAVVWLTCTFLSVQAAVRGCYGNHKQWAVLSIALTYSALTLRLMLLVPLLTDLPFLTVYCMAAWTSWLLNLGLAYWLVLPLLDR